MTGQSKKTEKLLKDFFFESDTDQALGIETAIYENGNHIKRFHLSDGREGIVRELKGRDMMKIEQMISADNSKVDAEEKYMCALYHFAVKIDGKQIPMEDFAEMKAKDFNKVKLATHTLNF